MGYGGERLLTISLHGQVMLLITYAPLYKQRCYLFDLFRNLFRVNELEILQYRFQALDPLWRKVLRFNLSVLRSGRHRLSFVVEAYALR